MSTKLFLPPNHLPWRLGAACLGLAFMVPAMAAPQTTNAPARKAETPVATSALPAQPPIPQSIFVVPRSPDEGRDPFFPESTRNYSSSAPAAKAAPTPAVRISELRLKGIFGQVDSRLAIINDKTLAAGEEADVLCLGGRVRIRCLEIHEDFVVIQSGDDRRELHLRSGF